MTRKKLVLRDFQLIHNEIILYKIVSLFLENANGCRLTRLQHRPHLLNGAISLPIPGHRVDPGGAIRYRKLCVATCHARVAIRLYGRSR